MLKASTDVSQACYQLHKYTAFNSACIIAENLKQPIAFLQCLHWNGKVL